jgi:hypothetical protein
MPATKYPDLFTWGVHSRTRDTFGDPTPTESWADGGKLRGRLEAVNASEETRTEAKRLMLRGTVYVRQYVGLKPLDRLTNVESEAAWKVLTVYSGDNETICEVESV